MAMSRSFGATLFTTRPAIAISPSLMFSSPAIMRNRVDLPQPEGPTRMTNSPSSISTLTPCNTSVVPKRLRTSRMDTLAIVVGRPFSALRWPGLARPSRPNSELRDTRLLRSDELQKRRLAGFGLLDAALDRRLDLVRIGDPLAVAAERFGHLGVVARDIGR